MNTNARTPAVRLLAAGLALTASLAVQAQQGFDQAPTYPAQAPQPMQQPMQPQQQVPMQPTPGQQMPLQAPAQPAQPYPDQPGMQQANAAAAIVQREMQDFGVPPQEQLQANLHGPTPTRIPGGQVVTTDRLLALYRQGMQNGGLLVFHVLGPGPTLPNAQNAVGASQPGSFQDATQQQFGDYLQQVTQGNKGVPMVFYCQSTQCWMSYNAALRAINLGYTQVYWYRGGIEAWQAVQNMSMNGNGGMTLQHGGGMQPPAGYRNAGYPQQPQQNQGGW